MFIVEKKNVHRTMFSNKDLQRFNKRITRHTMESYNTITILTSPFLFFSPPLTARLAFSSCFPLFTIRMRYDNDNNSVHSHTVVRTYASHIPTYYISYLILLYLQMAGEFYTLLNRFQRAWIYTRIRYFIMALVRSFDLLHIFPFFFRCGLIFFFFLSLLLK